MPCGSAIAPCVGAISVTSPTLRPSAPFQGFPDRRWNVPDFSFSSSIHQDLSRPRAGESWFCQRSGIGEQARARYGILSISGFDVSRANAKPSSEFRPATCIHSENFGPSSLSGTHGARERRLIFHGSDIFFGARGRMKVQTNPKLCICIYTYRIAAPVVVFLSHRGHGSRSAPPTPRTIRPNSPISKIRRSAPGRSHRPYPCRVHPLFGSIFWRRSSAHRTLSSTDASRGRVLRVRVRFSIIARRRLSLTLTR